jgi:hypothetical protein
VNLIVKINVREDEYPGTVRQPLGENFIGHSSRCPRRGFGGRRHAQEHRVHQREGIVRRLILEEQFGQYRLHYDDGTQASTASGASVESVLAKAAKNKGLFPLEVRNTHEMAETLDWLLGIREDGASCQVCGGHSVHLHASAGRVLRTSWSCAGNATSRSIANLRGLTSTGTSFTATKVPVELKWPGERQFSHDDEHEHEGKCEKCGLEIKSKPRKRFKGEARRTRSTISLKVPKDADEDGAGLLDEAVATLESKISGENPRPVYFTIMDALNYTLLNAGEDDFV